MTPANLQPGPDLVIVGNVITRKNPEAAALAELNIPYLSFPQALAHFFIQSQDLPGGRRHPRQNHHLFAAGHHPA